jgi:hypothetical protein
MKYHLYRMPGAPDRPQAECRAANRTAFYFSINGGARFPDYRVRPDGRIGHYALGI